MSEQLPDTPEELLVPNPDVTNPIAFENPANVALARARAVLTLLSICTDEDMNFIASASLMQDVLWADDGLLAEVQTILDRSQKVRRYG